MRKFECNSCEADCELTMQMDELTPSYCLYDKEKANWHEVVDSAENAQTTSEQFGNSEQLPDWVKVGNLVYCSKTGIYGEIKTIKDNKIYLCIVNSDEVFPVKLNMVLKNGRPARKRPFNEVEMKALVGKVIEDKDTGNTYLINQHNKKRNDIKFGGVWLTNKNLMDNDNYTIDGKPCFKLEHLENGEWVE